MDSSPTDKDPTPPSRSDPRGGNTGKGAKPALETKRLKHCVVAGSFDYMGYKWSDLKGQTQTVELPAKNIQHLLALRFQTLDRARQVIARFVEVPLE